MDKSDAQSGFTLLELLISLSLLAVIMVFITSAMSFSHRAWKQSENLNRKAPVSVVRNFLRRNISSAFAARVRGANNNIEVVFKGERTKIEFVTALPDRVVVGGLYKLSVFQQDGNLKVNIHSYHPNRKGGDGGDSKVLLSGVSALHLSYYGQEKNDVSAAWHTVWKRKDIAPSLVQMNLHFEDNRQWRPLIIELKLH